MGEPSEILAPIKRSHDRRRKLVGAVVGAIALAALSGFWSWTRTPGYAIRQIETAMRVHDIQAFRKYVDLVDGVAADSLALVRMSRPASGALELAIEAPLQDTFKRTLTNMVENQDAGPPRIVYDFLDLDSSYSGIEYVKRNGKVAIVGFKFTTPKRSTKPRVYEVRMRNLGSHWQVSGLNLSQILLAKNRREAEERERLEAERAKAAPVVAESFFDLASKASTSLSMSLGQSAVIGGASSEVWGRLAISEPAFGDILVTVDSDSSAARVVPSLVTIPKGQTGARFLVRASAVPKPVQAELTAEAYGTKRTVTLLIEPRTVTPPQPETRYEYVYLDQEAREFHVSTCKAAIAAANGQPPTWNYSAMVAQGIPRAKDCANLPLPISTSRSRK